MCKPYLVRLVGASDLCCSLGKPPNAFRILQEPGMFRREEDSLFDVWYNVPALVGLLIHLIKVVTVVAVVTDGLTLSTLEYHGSSLVHAIMLARVKSPGGGPNQCSRTVAGGGRAAW